MSSSLKFASRFNFSVSLSLALANNLVRYNSLARSFVRSARLQLQQCNRSIVFLNINNKNQCAVATIGSAAAAARRSLCSACCARKGAVSESAPLDPSARCTDWLAGKFGLKQAFTKRNPVTPFHSQNRSLILRNLLQITNRQTVAIDNEKEKERETVWKCGALG